MNRNQRDSSNGSRSQQEGSKMAQACYSCHLRKVKCDLVECADPPCTRCSQLDIPCRRFARSQRKGRIMRAMLDESGSIASERLGNKRTWDRITDDVSNDFGSLGEGDTPRHLVVKGLGDFRTQSSILIDFLSQDFSRESISGYQVTFNDNYCNIARVLGNEFGQGFKEGVYHHRDAPFVETSQAGLPRTLTAAERGVLELQGAFVLPAQTVSDSFVTAFFDRVYPALPIVDRSDFMRRYYTMGLKDATLSLLLLHSILLAGSTTYQHAGLALSASEVSRRLYGRAKALVETRFEQDRLILVQAHLLFATFASDSCDDTVQNVWLSIGTAARIAQGLGMHRSLGNANAGPAMRRAWKRIWWTLFVHDTLCSFEWGRPRAIHLDDCDVDLLEDGDFEPEETGALPSAEASQFLKAICNLCFIIGDWLDTLRPGSRRHKPVPKEEMHKRREAGTRRCFEELTSWREKLPAILQSPRLSGFSLWAGTLHIAYCATRLRFAALLPDGMNIVHVMAGEITKTCEELHSQGLLLSLWNFGVHELDLAMGQHARQANSSDSVAAALGLQRLRAGLPLIKLLSERSSVADQGAVFYEKLVKRAANRLVVAPQEQGGNPARHQDGDQSASQIMPENSPTQTEDLDWLNQLDLDDIVFSDWIPRTHHPWGWDMAE